MKYEQVNTWHMARKAIRPVMFKQVGYEALIYIEMVYDAYDV